MTSNHRTVLITGASSGIGEACALELHRRGHRVFGTSRDPERARACAAAQAGVEMLVMDVNSDDSVRAGVELVAARAGRLDAVVNNAGFGMAGAVEDTSIEEAQAQFETNLFGIWRVCRAVLPVMRQQGGGTIVNMSTLGARVCPPYQVAHFASKFALEGFAEGLSAEVRPLGIRVVLIEPGNMATPFHVSRRWTAQQTPVYQEHVKRAVEAMEYGEEHGLPPAAVARVVADVVVARRPRLRYIVSRLLERVLLPIRSVLPDRWFEALIIWAAEQKL